MLFWWLIVAHVFGDYVFQSTWLAQNKGTNYYVLLIHSIIWTACIIFVLYSFGIFALWKIPFLIIFHGLSDYLKWRNGERPGWKPMLLDQLWHYCQLIIVGVF